MGAGVALGVLGFLALQLFHSRSGAVEVFPAEIVVDGGAADAGSVTTSFQLANRTWRSVDLDLRLSCQCGTVTPSRLTIPAGQTRTVRVEAPASSFGARARYHLNALDADSKQLLVQATLHGGAFPRVTTPVRAVQMAVLGDGGTSERDLVVSNPSQRPFSGRLAVLGLAAPYIEVSPESITLEPGATATVRIQAAHPGHRRVRGLLQFLDEKARQAHAVDLVLTGQSRYAANPPGIVWSEDEPPQAPLVVELSRQDGAQFAIQSARLDPEVPWLDVVAEDPPGATPRVRLNVAPEARGRSYAGVLQILTDRTDEAYAPPIHVVAAKLSTGPGPASRE